MKLLENPEINERNIPEEGNYFEIEWELDETPTEEKIIKFEKLLKPFLEETNELFGPYKPKIFGSFLITTILDKSKINQQKQFFEDKFLSKIK